MALVHHVSFPFRYLLLNNVTDVATIIAALNTELQALGWIDEGGMGTGPFKNPTGTDGKFLRITLTRSSATLMYWLCSDSGQLVINNSNSPPNTGLGIPVGGANVHLVTGTDFICADVAAATPECFMVGRMDIWPDSMATCVNSFFCTRGPRTNAGVLGNQTLQNIMARREDTGAYIEMGSTYDELMRPYSQQNELVSCGGSRLTIPMVLVNYVTAVYLGCFPLCILANSNNYAYGAIINAPIGDGQVGQFRVVALSNASLRILAVRIA